MSSRMARSRLWWMPPPVRKLRPSISASGRPAATSWIVKSNSLRATKSIASDARSAASGATATWAPTKPIRSRGLASLSASATRRSERKEGVLV